MSSLTEKVLMIGFGATICLSLFSAITPLLNQLQFESGTSSYNRDVLSFYQMITEIERDSKSSIQLPDQDFRIHYNFSRANSIQFSKANNSTLYVEMELESQVFVQITEFQINFAFYFWGNPVEVESVIWTRTEESDDSIDITFDLFQLDNYLYFEFWR